MTDIDDILLAGARSKGKRPYFFDHPETERVLSITMAVAAELAVTRERLDTLERLLEERGVISGKEIEAFRPQPQAATERQRAQRTYIARILRIVQQELEALKQGKDDQDLETLAEEVGG